MDTWVTIKEFVVEWYPIVLGAVTAVLVALGSAYLVYTQARAVVQPVLDKLQAFRDKDDAIKLNGDILEKIKVDTLKADLLYKIENTSVSPELTMIYQAQLDKLNALSTSTNTVLDTVEETVNKYT